MVTRRQAYMPHARHWVAKLTQAALPNSLRWKPGCLEALSLQPLALQLTGPAHGFRSFAGAALGRLLVMPPKLHFAENPLPLHLLLERLERLVDVVVTHEDLHLAACSFSGHIRRSDAQIVRSQGFRLGDRRYNMALESYKLIFSRHG